MYETVRAENQLSLDIWCCRYSPIFSLLFINSRLTLDPFSCCPTARRGSNAVYVYYLIILMSNKIFHKSKWGLCVCSFPFCLTSVFLSNLARMWRSFDLTTFFMVSREGNDGLCTVNLSIQTPSPIFPFSPLYLCIFSLISILLTCSRKSNQAGSVLADCWGWEVSCCGWHH